MVYVELVTFCHLTDVVISMFHFVKMRPVAPLWLVYLSVWFNPKKQVI